MILKYTAQNRDGGKSVYTVMRKTLSVSASLVRRLKNCRGIYVDGKPVFTTYILSPGETLSLDLSASEPPCDIVPQEGEINIICESEGLIAVNKPFGMLSHPSRSKYTGTLSNYVAGYLARSGGSGCCHAVGRLDRDTSGVVLFAKNSYFKALCSQALSAPEAEKEYIALVYGVISPETGTISLPIKRKTEGDMLRVVSSDGQRAVTHYETLKTFTLNGHSVSLIRLRLETGRTHQIRVHCLSAGHPVLGDVLYNNELSRAASLDLSLYAQALHAYRLSFSDPATNETVTLTAPVLREDMKKILKYIDFTEFI